MNAAKYGELRRKERVVVEESLVLFTTQEVCNCLGRRER
jgi:hypothetical protein